MARMLFGGDLSFRKVNGYHAGPAAGVGTVFSAVSQDPASGVLTGVTVCADLLAFDGTPITGGLLQMDLRTDTMPLVWGPDGVDDLWVSVDGGPVVPFSANTDARLDLLEALAAAGSSSLTVEAAARVQGDAATLASAATDASTKAGAAQSAAIAAAAADATTKANAAQAAATAAAATDATAKANAAQSAAQGFATSAVATQHASDLGTYAPSDPTLTITYNTDGTVATVVENGTTTVYTYNADGTVATSTRGSNATRTYTYTSGNLTAVA